MKCTRETCRHLSQSCKLAGFFSGFYLSLRLRPSADQLVDMCRAAVFLLASAPFCSAQQMIVSTRIFTEPAGAEFFVDGQRYHDSATFLWPEHSKHLLSANAVFSPAAGVQYWFKRWENSLGDKILEGTTLAITADRDNPFVKAVWLLGYGISLAFNNGSGAMPFACTPGPQWGKVYINIPNEDSCYSTDQYLWGEAGKTVKVQAYPPPGFAFIGWTGNVASTAATLSFTLNKPMMLSAGFEPAVQVRLETSPPTLALYADQTEVRTPITLDWAPGTHHMLGAQSPQRDQYGQALVFHSWSDGGEQYHSFTAGNSNVPATLTARFVPGIPFTFNTDPAGLQLSVDGRTAWQGYSFFWASGSHHEVQAPAEQADLNGRWYAFKSWSNGGPAAQSLTVEKPETWTARFERLSVLTVRTVPPGVTVNLDGEPCANPCAVHRVRGSVVRLVAPAVIANTADTRMEFQGWQDLAGGAAGPERALTLAADNQALTAVYSSRYRLAMESVPAGSAVIRCDPASADASYLDGTSVSVRAEAAPGWRFSEWEGDLSGNYFMGTVRMSAPRSVRAVMSRREQPAPIIVQNAAAETPAGGVAAGSIVSIYGSNLALAAATAAPGVLPQVLGGASVRVGDRLLGLLFVSPTQINAQLPWDLEPGDYSLSVLEEGRNAASTTFAVVRNAPGLFAGNDREAIAAHDDGSPITRENPVRSGEIVVLYGTGLGPYDRRPPEGFPIPSGLVYLVADPVEVLIGDRVVAPLADAAAAGQVGITLIQFGIPDPLPPGPIEIRIRVNRVESNTVELPSGAGKNSENAETASD